MYSKANKVLSIAMSAAIMLTNLMTPMMVYADEVTEPAQDLESEMPPETEPVSYYLKLPYNEAVSYSVNENYVVTNDNPGNMDIRLAYHEEDKVEFAFQTDDTVQVMEIHLTDLEKQEYPFSIDDNRNITLFMPAKDLELTLIMEEIPVPDPVPETEQPAEPAPASETEQPVEPIPVPAAETEGTWEQPAVQEEGINAFDLTAQEVTGDQSSYIPEDLVPEDNQENVQADDADRNIADGTNMEDISTQPDPENGNEVASTETGEDPFDPVEETREIPEDGSGETAGEIDNPDTPGIALTAETEEDGLPTQGSILTAETLTIPLMDVDFIPETDFSNISFNPETDRIELVSDEVDITNPGTYSTIYRVTHNGGEKMWYVLRPVTVSEETSSGSPEISLDDEIPTDSLQEPAFPEEGVDASEELSVAEAFETEPATAVNEEEDQKELQEQIHPEEETEELQTEETENLSEEETEALTETETYESKIPSAITYGVWRTPDELISPTVEDENGNTDVYSVTVENHLEGTGVILSQEDGMYAAGSVVQASVTGNTGTGFILSVAAGDEVLFGTIDFGSEDPLPVYFYMPDGDVKIVLDGLSAAQIEAGVNEDGEEEIGIPFAGKMLKAAVNSSSLKQHTAADISYINFTSGEKAYFPNGYDAATMKTVVIY